MYQVSIQNFSGPLDLLLQLVESKNLSITDLSLAQVTQEYISYINEQENIDPQELADFLVIASTLLLIKSKALLPSLTLNNEEEKEILDLETRLKIYKKYKEAAEFLKGKIKKEIFVINRSSWFDVTPSFSPPLRFEVDYLANSLQNILEQITGDKEIILEEKKIEKIKTLEERIKELIERLTKGNKYKLSDLVEDKESKIDLILTFLAILHLAKRKIISLQQNNNFDEIWISSQS